jgi:hypothetical protein
MDMIDTNMMVDNNPEKIINNSNKKFKINIKS